MVTSAQKIGNSVRTHSVRTPKENHAGTNGKPPLSWFSFSVRTEAEGTNGYERVRTETRHTRWQTNKDTQT